MTPTLRLTLRQTLTRRINTSMRALSGSTAPEYDPEKKLMYITHKESQYTLGKHRSNALELLDKQPIIEVDSDTAVCDGGGGALGHPIEYIQLAHMGGEPNACKYCGLKFVRKGGGH
eukprot:CAMPEP_0196811126 /NCGR_PEP_ID=MMETSP1362-20130617/16966_1 /TAXON_ID=163516 /ORGANISM="Leptocylindrus danicus, Strain CCMP1856" /LENGTH=116 /DNA_ID=CAMNT_0042186381 /DNA_START=14 /DNA_END=364 /DNA_ORIENTATION=-